MTKSKNRNAARHVWTLDEVARLALLYPEQKAETVAELLALSIHQVYAKANALGLKKSAAFMAGDQAGRIFRGQQNPAMIATRFQPGHSSWNKGSKGVVTGGVQTQFKPGQRPHTWVPVGTYRINGDGYLDQKITDEGPAYKHWEAVHRLIWKRAHGAIPANHVVTFKSGTVSTVLAEITPNALECISRKELVQRNHPARKSPELFRLVQLRGAITRQINRRLKAATTEGAST